MIGCSISQGGRDSGGLGFSIKVMVDQVLVGGMPTPAPGHCLPGSVGRLPGTTSIRREPQAGRPMSPQVSPVGK